MGMVVSVLVLDMEASVLGVVGLVLDMAASQVLVGILKLSVIYF